ncbi:MAG: hypothetical protein TE42_04690 [Candidatus Synechococcus spongiarum SP3]|uniref:Uncharacterized protein n=1 Tax=Candidatus Synechococcus spongiarum SP3 TaxID=1604020 RepID=A0A0G2HL76_9SYNE|nr:MAG: hypothetical protein TE42_04690 [Candidatus Synechococcus spongiarum SP3]
MPIDLDVFYRRSSQVLRDEKADDRSQRTVICVDGRFLFRFFLNGDTGIVAGSSGNRQDCHAGHQHGGPCGRNGPDPFRAW